MKDIWKQPTRRAFVALLGLGAAALATIAKKKSKPTGEPEEARSTWTGTTRWIGHC